MYLGDFPDAGRHAAASMFVAGGCIGALAHHGEIGESTTSALVPWDWSEQHPGVSDALSDVIAELDLDTGERSGMTGDQPGSARDAAAMHLL